MESVIHQPSFSKFALWYVSGGLLGRQSRSIPRELDFEEPGLQEGPFRIQLLLGRHPLYVYVLGSEAPEEVQGLNGATPDKLGLCQSLDFLGPLPRAVISSSW